MKKILITIFILFVHSLNSTIMCKENDVQALNINKKPPKLDTITLNYNDIILVEINNNINILKLKIVPERKKQNNIQKELVEFQLTTIYKDLYVEESAISKVEAELI